MGLIMTKQIIMLEKLLELLKTISDDNKFLRDIQIFSDKEKNKEDNPFNTTEECRQYIIDGIQNGSIKTREDVYKIFGLEIINCKSGEILAYID